MMKPIEMIWAMFKVYLNNPNYFVKQEDVLANLCMEGSTDVIRECVIHWEYTFLDPRN